VNKPAHAITNLLLSRKAFIVWIIFQLSGCGYAMESQQLWNNAKTISIDIVQNKTEKGGLDIQVKSVVRELLSNRPNVRLASPRESDLSLEITLTTFQIDRSVDITNTNISHLSYRLGGSIKLRDNRAPEKSPPLRNVSVVSSTIFQQAVLETPAVRDEALHHILSEFAKSVESHLYSNL